jgi:purine-binding chemotaxis protein CheW
MEATGTSVALPNAARGQIGSVASGPIAAEEQYVTFTVGSEEYGVNILSVREIRGWTPET